MIYYGPEKLDKLLEDSFADDDELALEGLLFKCDKKPVPCLSLTHYI